ncbi:hypothetical protein BDV96DRAFT_602686 [Lophiotrema nucula]|uniref:Uncharacterized protein n=1 Tax=Lophiotrema nucula TaxID=690887 RepID=A0A6A5YXR3_9PLEO|nr:hypothetical protein BDV96DRAFT_602686 [Lophiotrema nucula]
MASSIPVVNADVGCPDPTRSITGTWVLSDDLEPRVDELKSQDPSRITSQCFQLLGAEWDDEWNVGLHPLTTHFFEDPVKTTRTRISYGEEHRGAWGMAQGQKAEADALKTAKPDWEWSRCCEAAGGVWVAYYFYLYLDNVWEVPSDTSGS